MIQNPKIYNIPAEQNFFQQLTKGIIDKFKATCNLKNVIILLPTKHACNSLRQAFLESGQQIPKICPINDLSDILNLPLLNHPIEKISLVAKISQMILNLKHNNFNNIIAVTELAEYFANFLHNAGLHQIDLNQAMQIIDEDLTLHQQELLGLLKTFIKAWQADSSLTKAEYNNLLLKYFANNLAKHTLVIAGISSNIPSIINLMLKQSTHIVFYGLDQHLNKLEWENLSVIHPQYNLKQILAKLSIDRSKVLNWSNQNKTSSTFLSEAMKPAIFCNNWHQLSTLDSSNINYLSCQDQHQEAKAIMEYIQNNSNLTTMVITNDDALMVKLMHHFNKAKIDANIIRDYPLVQSETAIWLELCLNFVTEDFSLISALALLKNPFSAIDPEILIELEMAIRDRNFRNNNIFDAPEFFSSMASFVENAQIFKQSFSSAQVSFKKLLEAHLYFSENIAIDQIWQHTSGRELQLYLKQIEQNSHFLGDILTQDYPLLFSHLLKSAYYREEQKPARITLTKPIDARLHSAELMILAGLNETIWPAKPTIDPCFNNNLLNKIGLPNFEQSIGEEAYDFQCFASNKKVILTRSEKTDGVITTPSRWLLRILTLARNIKVPLLANNLITVNSPNSLNLAPTPAIEYRPTQLSVTQVEKLVFNPYHIYVDLILKLKKLPPLVKKISALDFGIFVHKAIEIYERNADRTYDSFIESGTKALNILNLNYPQFKLIYWPRFIRIAEWFVANQFDTQIYLESFGSLKINDNFTLTARADRIEVTKDNSLNIIDYKTGRLNSLKSIYDGQSLQLLLEGVIGLNGGFYFQKTTSKINKLAYIQLSGGEDPVEILEIDIDEKPIIEQTKQYINTLITEYQNSNTPYYYTKKKTMGYCEYEHLARMFGK